MEKTCSLGKVCVAVGAENVAAALAAAKKAEAAADVIEIRLDTLSDAAIAPFINELSTPLLFTNRPQWEGGGFKGDDTARLELLLEAVKSNAAYVDIELKTDEELRNKLLAAAKKTKTQVIISWHDFKLTPSDRALASVFENMYRSGADIGKIVSTANCFQDVLRVLNLQETAAEMGLPLIAFSMGRAGKISRFATLELNGYMTYAASTPETATAPGQLTAAELNNLLEIWKNAD